MSLLLLHVYYVNCNANTQMGYLCALIKLNNSGYGCKLYFSKKIIDPSHSVYLTKVDIQIFWHFMYWNICPSHKMWLVQTINKQNRYNFNLFDLDIKGLSNECTISIGASWEDFGSLNNPSPGKINFICASLNLLFPRTIPPRFGSIWLSSFRQKIKMCKKLGRHTTDIKSWEELTWPLVRWDKNIYCKKCFVQSEICKCEK